MSVRTRSGAGTSASPVTNAARSNGHATRSSNGRASRRSSPFACQRTSAAPATDHAPATRTAAATRSAASCARNATDAATSIWYATASRALSAAPRTKCAVRARAASTRTPAVPPPHSVPRASAVRRTRRRAVMNVATSSTIAAGTSGAVRSMRRSVTRAQPVSRQRVVDRAPNRVTAPVAATAPWSCAVTSRTARRSALLQVWVVQRDSTGGCCNGPEAPCDHMPDSMPSRCPLNRCCCMTSGHQRQHEFRIFPLG